MPSGIILSSASQGTDEERQAAVEKVLADNGYEPDQPAAKEEQSELVEPKREEFTTDEEFEAAQEEHEAKLEEAEAAKEAEEEKKRLEALPKKSRRQKAVEKATKDLNDKLRAAEVRLAALEGKGAGKEKPGDKPAAAELKAPKREDFDSDEKYEDALFDYRYKLRRAKEESESAQNRLKERLTQNFTDYKDSVAAFKEEHDDWDTVVNQSIAIPEAVYYAVVDLGKEGPAVTYYLGQHPEKLEALAEMTPYRTAIEIGRLADKLKSGAKPTAGGEKPKTVKPKPTLPEPVKPVTTSATSSTTTSREAAQKRDYRAFKLAQRRGA
jgi:hypothetical protein